MRWADMRMMFGSEPMRATRLSLVLAAALAVPTSGCSVERVRPPSEIRGTDTCSLPHSFQDSSADLQVAPGDHVLPRHIRTRLKDYLVARVGPLVAETLRIREVWYLRNSPTRGASYPHGDEPSGVAYAVFVGLPVADDMSDCGTSVDREYCAGIWLSANGDPLNIIGLPDTAHDPSKTNLISRAEAEAAVANTDLEFGVATLNYEQGNDILVWQLMAIRSLPGGKRDYFEYVVNAHTGKVLGWSNSSVVY